MGVRGAGAWRWVRGASCDGRKSSSGLRRTVEREMSALRSRLALASSLSRSAVAAWTRASSPPRGDCCGETGFKRACGNEEEEVVEIRESEVWCIEDEGVGSV